MPTILFLHLSWTTVDRRPMIGPTEKAFLSRFLPAEARRHGARIIVCGMVADHVHLFLRLPGRFDVPTLVQSLKGTSSRLASMNDAISLRGLRWARGYHAKAVCPSHAEDVVRYIRAQDRRHPELAIDSRNRM